MTDISPERLDELRSDALNAARECKQLQLYPESERWEDIADALLELECRRPPRTWVNQFLQAPSTEESK